MFRVARACVKLVWQAIRVGSQMLYGVWKLSKLKHPPISIFGSARLALDNRYVNQARELARMLMESNIPVLTGGGPGIMEAASCSHSLTSDEKDIVSIGITVKGFETEVIATQCDQVHIVMDHFFSRKWLLITYSIGFAVFPGGYGTIDELSEILTLIQTKMRKPMPIVLLGVDYWKPFIDWLKHTALPNDTITHADLELIVLTDDLHEAYNILKEHALTTFSVFE